MKKVLLLSLIIGFVSCKAKNEFEDQIKNDLIGMLMNKVIINQISVSEVSKIDESTQKVVFDCNIFYIDNLYKDNGELAFKKGMRIKEQHNIFYYSCNANQLKLIKLEFGETISVN